MSGVCIGSCCIDCAINLHWLRADGHVFVNSHEINLVEEVGRLKCDLQRKLNVHCGGVSPANETRVRVVCLSICFSPNNHLV